MAKLPGRRSQKPRRILKNFRDQLFKQHMFSGIDFLCNWPKNNQPIFACWKSFVETRLTNLLFAVNYALIEWTANISQNSFARCARKLNNVQLSARKPKTKTSSNTWACFWHIRIFSEHFALIYRNQTNRQNLRAVLKNSRNPSNLIKQHGQLTFFPSRSYPSN